jgi:hypothetical protein
MGNRFASQQTTRIELSDGDWLEVRDELSLGRQQKLAGAGIGGLQGFDGGDLANVRMELDLSAFEIQRILAWVTEWSFRDATGRPVALTREAVENLNAETAEEIKAALDEHVAAVEEKKALRATRNGAAATSR